MTGPTDMLLTYGPEAMPLEVLQAHMPPGVPHVAVSVQIVDGAGNWLVQQRAYTKRLFAGRWANSCCTHPRPGEHPLAAGRRRIREELGINVPDLVQVGEFAYRATDRASGLVEHEHDHVLVGRLTGPQECTPDPAEVSSVGWLPFDVAAALVNGSQGAPWAWTVIDLVRAFLDG